jgi:hypothetical protein
MKRSFLLGMGCTLLCIIGLQQVAKAQAATFADPKYVDMGKASLEAMQSGNVSQWMETALLARQRLLNIGQKECPM